VRQRVHVTLPDGASAAHGGTVRVSCGDPRAEDFQYFLEPAGRVPRFGAGAVADTRSGWASVAVECAPGERAATLPVALAESATLRVRAVDAEGREVCPPPPPRTKWTRRVPHPVLIGHVASLTPY
jgi:hypothetical protein